MPPSNSVVEVTRVRSGDLDGDGDIDAIVATRAADILLINDGRGAMQDRSSQLPSPVQFTGDVQLVDFDGDGDLDAVMGEQLPDGVRILLNDGRATFHPGQPHGTPVVPKDFVLADFDADGKPDAAANCLNSVSVHLNTCP